MVTIEKTKPIETILDSSKEELIGSGKVLEEGRPIQGTSVIEKLENVYAF